MRLVFDGTVVDWLLLTGGEQGQQQEWQGAGHTLGLSDTQDPHRHPAGGHSERAEVSYVFCCLVCMFILL